MLKILDFNAPWCKPCQTMKPILKEIKSEYPKIEIQFIDVDDPKNVYSVSNYNIRNIPCFIFEKDGEIVHKIVGAQSKEQIIKIINQYA